jgi:hypothetical protein
MAASRPMRKTRKIRGPDPPGRATLSELRKRQKQPIESWHQQITIIPSD